MVYIVGYIGFGRCGIVMPPQKMMMATTVNDWAYGPPLASPGFVLRRGPFQSDPMIRAFAFYSFEYLISPHFHFKNFIRNIHYEYTLN